MSNYFDVHVVNGLRSEMRKIAVSRSELPAGMDKEALSIPWQSMKKGLTTAGGALKNYSGAIGSFAGAGALVGGVAGAGLGGYRSYRDARRQGASGADAGMSALGGAMGGASKGALIGGVAGGVAGGGLKALGGKPESLTQVPYIGAGARRGQQVAHSITGWTPEGGLGQLGLGAEPLRQRAAMLAADPGQLGDAPQGRLGAVSHWMGKHLGGHRLKRWMGERELARLPKAIRAAEDVEKMNLTNLPGFVESLRADPKGTLSASFRNKWHGTGTAGKLLTFGVPTAFGAYNVLRDDPNSSRLSRVANMGASTLGSFAFSPLAPIEATLNRGLTGATSKITGRFDRGHRPREEEEARRQQMMVRAEGGGV